MTWPKRPACACCGRWAGWRIQIGAAPPFLLCRRCTAKTWSRAWRIDRWIAVADGGPATWPLDLDDEDPPWPLD